MPRFITALWESFMGPIATRTRSKLGSLLRRTNPVQYKAGQLLRKRREKKQSVGRPRKIRKTAAGARRSRKADKHSKTSSRKTRKYRKNMTSKRRYVRANPPSNSRRYRSRPTAISKQAPPDLTYYDTAKNNSSTRRLKKSQIELVRYPRGRGINKKIAAVYGSKYQRQSRRQKTGVRRRNRSKIPPTSKWRMASRGARTHSLRRRRTSTARHRKASRSRKRKRTASSRRYRRYSSGKTERSSKQVVTRSISQERQDFIQDPPHTPRTYVKRPVDETEDDPLNVRRLYRAYVRRLKEAPADPRDQNKGTNARKSGVGRPRLRRKANQALKKQVRRHGNSLLSLRKKSTRRTSRKS